MNHRQKVDVESATIDDYLGLLQDVLFAVQQRRMFDAGKVLGPLCGICASPEHKFDACPNNPLLRALLGDQAREGEFWKCFHCDGVFTDKESAEKHFGTDVTEIALCLFVNLVDDLKKIQDELRVAANEYAPRAVFLDIADRLNAAGRRLQR